MVGDGTSCRSHWIMQRSSGSRKNSGICWARTRETYSSLLAIQTVIWKKKSNPSKKSRVQIAKMPLSVQNLCFNFILHHSLMFSSKWAKFTSIIDSEGIFESGAIPQIWRKPNKMLLNTGEMVSWVPSCTNYAFRIDLNFFGIILEKTKLFITIGVSQKWSILGLFWQIFEIFFKKLTFRTNPFQNQRLKNLQKIKKVKTR